MTILLLLANLLVCEALRERMGREPEDWTVITGSDPQAVKGLAPDVVIADFPSLAEHIFTLWPEANFLLLDMGLPIRDIVGLTRLYRIDGVLSVDTDVTLLKRAVKAVRNGEIWIDHIKLKAILRDGGARRVEDAAGRLTPRERHIVRKVAEGLRNRDVAEQLFLSEQTVKSHINRIFKKLNVSSRSQLVNQVMKNGILDNLS